MKEIKTYFGKNLKKLRNKKGYTQENLAEKIGIDRRQLTRIETSKSFPSLETLDSLCFALNIEAKQLFDFEELTNETKDKKQTVLDIETKIFYRIQSKINEYKNQTQKLKFIQLAVDCLENKKSISKLQNVLEGMLL